MAQVFISYSRKDRDLAQLVASGLTAEGMSVWWDRDIASGERWDKVIKRELDAAGAVVVLWTPNSVEADATISSEWVANEAAEARRREILVPVLSGGGATPFEFQRIQSHDLNGWTGERSANAWRVLAERIRAVAGLPMADVDTVEFRPAPPPPPRDEPKPLPPPIVNLPPPPPPAFIADSGTAVLRMRRLNRINSMFRQFAVLVDGEKVGEIGNDQEAEFEVGPGPHLIQLRVDFYKSEGVETVFHPGQTLDFTCAAVQATDLKGLVQPLQLVQGTSL
jgi:hypothetical protein